MSVQTLVLIGLRGSGKTTLGRALAAELARPFIDLDTITASMLDEPDPGAAFRAHGQATFRETEARALKTTLASPGIVLALGGGTPTAPGAADLLREEQARARVTIAYLRASAETLRQRLAASDVDRPSLTGDDPLAEIEKILDQRDTPYRELANAVIEQDGLDQELVLAALLDWATSADTLG